MFKTVVRAFRHSKQREDIEISIATAKKRGNKTSKVWVLGTKARNIVAIGVVVVGVVVDAVADELGNQLSKGRRSTTPSEVLKLVGQKQRHVVAKAATVASTSLKRKGVEGRRVARFRWKNA